MWFKKNEKSSKCSIDTTLPYRMENNIEMSSLKKILGKSSDVKLQEIFINGNEKFSATLIYIDGMVNIQYLSDYILKPIAQEVKFGALKNIKEVISLIKGGGVYFPSLSESKNPEVILTEILSGQAALLFEQCDTAIIFDVKGFEKRAITETTNENILSGAKDCFVETLNVNTAMVRRKLKTKHLVIEKAIIGDETNTGVAMIYVEGIAETSLIEDIREKIKNIDILGMLSPGGIEELILDSNYSTFPQLLNTERVDKFCSNVLEGRVGIIIDGFPVGYVLPSLFIQFLQVPENYSENIIVSTLIRILRYGLMILTMAFPGFYISLTSFNVEMIPDNLANAISKYRIGVTFPSFIETILMVIAFEILLEAGNRMPKNIGQAVSVVGALIVGEAAVNAKLVSPSVVIVVALTAIAGFSAPIAGFANALRIWRLIATIASSVLGLVGLIFTAIALLFCLVKIENFGVPYMAPLVSTDGEDMRDVISRPSAKSLKKQFKYHKSLKSGGQ
jgi:spore germination protein KA